VDQVDQTPQLGIVLLQTPQGTSFDSEVRGVVERLGAAGLVADRAGNVLAVEHRGSRALLTPEPAPLSWNDAFGPWIAAHQSPDGLHERYRTHTGLLTVQVGTAGDAAVTRRLLLELVRLIAQHPTASVVTLPGDAKFWYAEQVRNWPAYLELAPAPVAPPPSPQPQPVAQPQPVVPPQPVAQRPSGPAVVAHVLLASVPATMGEALATLGPDTASRLAQVPPAPQVPVVVDGRELLVGVSTSPVPADALGPDLGVSPMRARLEPVAAAHRAVVSVTAEVGTDWAGAMRTVVHAVGRLLERDDAGAVWFPQQRLLTTDVLFRGDAANRPELNFARVHAMWQAAPGGPAIGFTQGLAALGGQEVQLVAHGVDPARLFEDLRQAVADGLATGTLPAPGGRLTVAGYPLHLVPTTSQVTGQPVLELRA
jgi:hypothetical protein